VLFDVISYEIDRRINRFAVHYHFYNNPLLKHIRSKLNPVHTLIPLLNKQGERNLNIKQQVIEQSNLKKCSSEI
jgi:hypothetical protein